MTLHEFSSPKKEQGVPVGDLEERNLPPNQETQLFSNLTPEELGLPPGIETVNGVINVGQDSEHNQTFAIASARNFKTGVNDTVIYKLHIKDSGNLGYEAGTIPMELNSQATHWFGRNPRANRPQEPGYVIKDKTETVSRLHFGLRKDESGAVFVTDAESTNGTSLVQRNEPAQATIERPATTSPASERASGAALRSFGVRPPEGMIMHVPSAEELESQKAEREQQRDDRLQEQIQAVEEQVDDIKSRYSEDVGLDMWRYASGLMNKADAQREGRGSESTAYGQQAGQAYRRLNSIQQRDADRYHSLFVKLDELRGQ